jgi:radical SAM protein with 4Fe4S-binding SPASM domain
MLYRGLLEVIREATALGLPVSIATNGHGLAKAAADLVAAPLFLLQVSVDGCTEAVHNQARPSAGRGNAFADVVAGLTAVQQLKQERRLKLPVVASLTVVSQQNVEHLVDIYNTFRDKVDIFVFYLSWWIDEEQAAAHAQDYCSRFGCNPQLHRGWIGNWRPRDYGILAGQFNELRRLSRTIGAPAVTFLPDLSSVEDLQKYYTDHTADFGYKECISIFQAVELDSNGDMSPCRDYHDYIVGNIKENTITELWNSPPYRTFRKSLRHQGLMPACRRCCGLMGY